MFNAKFWAGAAYFFLALPLFYYSHTVALPLVMAGIAMRCVYEVLHISGFSEARLLMPLGLCLAPLLCFCPYLGEGLWALSCYVYLLAALLLYLVHYDSCHLLQMVYCAFFTLLLSAGLSIPVQTRQLPGGQWLIVLTFAGTWAADTCAQLCGKLFGRHKLGIGVSPNKTVEGCVGSLLCTAAVYFLLGLALNRYAGTAVPLVLLTGAGLLVSLAAQVGDLLASAVKRCFGVKDFSRLIPGHGGMYDRFDSFALVAPMVYLLADLFALFA